MLAKIACRVILILAMPVMSSLQLAAEESTVDFMRDVRPILSEHCFHCHGPDSATREADLRLDQPESAAHVLGTTGDGGSSELLERITAEEADLRMPPIDSRKPLSQSQIETLKTWIATGAAFDRHWSLKQPQRPSLPAEQRDAWCATPVDTFILQALRRREMSPAPPAATHTLARRSALALTGLPPSVEELAAFEASIKTKGLDAAYADWIARLMASPRYGEHMTLPWLEAARYADTDGYQNDRYRYQHAWRDWVIRAFNQNMPYDQFVIEQVAGDMLPEPTLWQQVATGFGRNHRINSEDGSIPEEWLTENIVDRVDTLGTVFLGLTVGCARCHDHKYDPISQQEYYQLFAYFNNVAEHGVGPNNGNSPPFVELPASWPLLSAEEDRARVPEPVKLTRARETEGNGLRRPQAGSPQTVMVMHELPEPRETYVLLRGQYNVPDKSQRLWPGVPAALENGSDRSPPSNRLELAQWLVAGDNPLTARVAVNRIWQQLFGVGLVETSENFGSQGTLPSHPELLDWLAMELVASDWDLRHIQRLILLSSTFRQASEVSPGAIAADPENRWLSRGPRMRAPAAVLRDQALLVSGLLVDKIGGPSVKPYMPKDIWSSISNNKYEQDHGEGLFRRSLYTYWRRTIPPPTMVNFNAAAREICTVRTETTNTPLQALTLMNNVTFVEAAKLLAQRVMLADNCAPDEHGQPAELVKERIARVFLTCTARRPSPRESATLERAHQSFHSAFHSDLKAAKSLLSIGEAPYNQSLDPAEFAAMTMTTSLIMNLDETITIE